MARTLTHSNIHTLRHTLEHTHTHSDTHSHTHTHTQTYTRSHTQTTYTHSDARSLVVVVDIVGCVVYRHHRYRGYVGIALSYLSSLPSWPSLVATCGYGCMSLSSSLCKSMLSTPMPTKRHHVCVSLNVNNNATMCAPSTNVSVATRVCVCVRVRPCQHQCFRVWVSHGTIVVNTKAAMCVSLWSTSTLSVCVHRRRGESYVSMCISSTPTLPCTISSSMATLGVHHIFSSTPTLPC